jgi:hypothetical protein
MLLVFSLFAHHSIYLGERKTMLLRKMLLPFCAVAVALALNGTCQAGLTVTLIVNGNTIITDTASNSPSADGSLSAGDFFIDVDGDSVFDLFIASITAESLKNAIDGTINTTNFTVRSLTPGSFPVELIVEDDFSLPASVASQNFLVTSTITDLNALPTEVTFQTYFDGALVNTIVVDDFGDIGASDAGTGTTTGPSPFALKSRFTFDLDPGATVFFEASSVATIPEVATLAAWSICAGLGLFIAYRRKRVR